MRLQRGEEVREGHQQDALVVIGVGALAQIFVLNGGDGIIADQIQRSHELNLLQHVRIILGQSGLTRYRTAQLHLSAIVDQKQFAGVHSTVGICQRIHTGHLRQSRIGGAAISRRACQNAGDAAGVLGGRECPLADLDAARNKVDHAFIIGGHVRKDHLAHIALCPLRLDLCGQSGRVSRGNVHGADQIIVTVNGQSLKASFDVGICTDHANIERGRLGNVAQHRALDGGNVGSTQLAGDVAFAVDGMKAVGLGITQNHGNDAGGHARGHIVSSLFQRKSKFGKSHCIAPLS